MTPVETAKRQYAAQKHGAKLRGIGWQLTFAEWLEWWGADLERRGRHHDSLQMQRIADQGPYALGNIRKGHPKDNSKTMSNALANRKAAKAKRDHEAYLDALQWALSKEPEDEMLTAVTDMQKEIRNGSGEYMPQHFEADKRL
jgi:hypothetical protein